jgi:phage tail-like protein
MKPDLLTNYHFIVEWGGTRIGFEEVKNLSVGVQVIEYREGNSPEYGTIKMPGRPWFGNIELKRGATKGDNEFFKWWNTIKLNSVERRDITISLLNEEHQPVIIWRIRNAFPVKIVWADLKAIGNHVFIESLEIANEGISVESV